VVGEERRCADRGLASEHRGGRRAVFFGGLAGVADRYIRAHVHHWDLPTAVVNEIVKGADSRARRWGRSGLMSKKKETKRSSMAS